MSEQNIQDKPIPELTPISPDDIDKIIESGKIENLTAKFDALLNETVAHPNIAMFADTESGHIIASLNEEARKATEKAKADVKKALEEPEEEVPTVTMSDEDSKKMLGQTKSNIDPEERKKLIKDVKEQLSEVADELKKIIEEERTLNRDKLRLAQEMTRAKKTIDRSKIQTRISKLTNELTKLARRKKNVQAMREKYNSQLSSLQ